MEWSEVEYSAVRSCLLCGLAARRQHLHIELSISTSSSASPHRAQHLHIELSISTSSSSPLPPSAGGAICGRTPCELDPDRAEIGSTPKREIGAAHA